MLESNSTSLGAIQPACANRGSASTTTRCSRRRCHTITMITAAKIGTMMNM